MMTRETHLASITLLAAFLILSVGALILTDFDGITGFAVQDQSAYVDKEVEDMINAGEEVSVIVMLKDGPVRKTREIRELSNKPSKKKELRKQKLEAKKEMIRDKQDSVLSRLDIEERVPKKGEKKKGNLSISANDYDLKLKHKYSTVNGFSGKLTKKGLEKLRNNPDVKSISLNRKVSIALDGSIPQIDADLAWGIQLNSTNITGLGETVCVIDTGVDYTHPALGGCFGSGCKVIGGYDFVNDDSDPMDDQSINGYRHGTHCAGIVASTNNTYRGVAPDAKIVAIKALDASGSGTFGDIVAGIDWCVDNSADLNISVISMSIGVENTYYDTTYCDGSYSAEANAVNTAVANDITVFIAAGNDYPGGLGIAIPACLENATPIGAVTSGDGIEYQRGEILNVLAPGITITSSVSAPTNWQSKSGTSMATPHAAGLAALMNQFARLQGTTLSPQEIEDTLNVTGVAVYDVDSDKTYHRIDADAAILALDSTSPTVSLTSPQDNSISTNLNQTFSCNATDLQLANITLYLWNSSNGLVNQTTLNISGESNSTSFNITNLNYGNYEWNCLAYDENANSAFASSNYTLTKASCLESNVTYFLEPYVMAWNETTEIIRLETNQAANVTIEYGETTSYGSSISNSSFETKHELIINGLNPNTLYYYKVTVSNVSNSICYQNSTFNSTFRTSQDSKTSFSFAVIGDSRGSSCGQLGSAFSTLMADITSKNVDFVLMTGDDIQAEGCTNDDLYWQGFHNITGGIRKNTSFLSAIGNHEDPDRIAARTAWRNYWMHPLNGDGLSGHWNETTFYWSYGNSLFIFLNTEEREGGTDYLGDIAGNQFTWFNETALTQSGYAHKFVFAHKPLVGSSRSGTLYASNPSRSAMIDNEMYTKNVTAAFYGHDHYYCYNTTQNGEMLNIITGGGGAPLYSTSTCLGTGIQQYHYIIVNVSDRTINGTVYNLTGDIIHSFVRIMNKAPTAPTINLTPDSPTTADDLWCNVTTNSTDADNDVIQYYYEWYKNDVLDRTTLTTQLYDILGSGNTSGGDEWNCTVIPYDGIVNGTPDSDKVTMGNAAPEAQNVTISSTDSLNKTNGTLQSAWDYYDLNGDTQAANETRWYNNSVDVAALRNLTSVSPGNTTRNDVWLFSVRAYDGLEWGNWSNSSNLTIQNDVPSLALISDITVYETQLVNITANAADVDNEVLTYNINDTRFTKNNNQFTWQTGLTDEGVYVVSVNVTDGIALDAQNITVTVLNANDFDNDGNPDFNDTDDDNDGLADTSDFLKGDLSNINSSTTLRLRVNGTESLTKVFNETLTVNITDEDNNSLVEFDWNFNARTLTVNWTIDYNSTAGFIRIQDLDLTSAGITKTVYINQSDPTYNYVCISDTPNPPATLPSDCSGYTSVHCISSGQCIDLGDVFKVSSLSHSAVRSIYVDESDTGDGDTGDGGGGTGTSSGSMAYTGSTTKKTVVRVDPKAGEIYRIDLDLANLALTANHFSLNKDLPQVKITMEKLETDVIEVPLRNAYQYFRIKTEGMTNDDLKNAELEFRIDENWFDVKGYDENLVALNIYDGSWSRLPTYRSGSIDGQTYFTANTQRFLIFAITAEPIPAPIPRAVSETPEEEEPAVEEIAEAAEEKLRFTDRFNIKEFVDKNLNNILLGVIALIIAVMSYHLISGKIGGRNTKLEGYIRDSLNSGKNKSQIRKTVVKAGWPEDIVDKELGRFKKGWLRR